MDSDNSSFGTYDQIKILQYSILFYSNKPGWTKTFSGHISAGDTRAIDNLQMNWRLISVTHKTIIVTSTVPVSLNVQ